MTKPEGDRQVIEQSADATSAASDAAVYEAPRLVQLGQTSDVIRGNWTSGVWDALQGYKQWYVSGE